MTNRESVTFLIVDDDEVAVMAIKRALKKLRLVNPIEVVGDGQEALDLLRGVNSAALERPYIILLDLNMPRMGGLEFLAEVREDKELANSVIFVLTTSDAPSDIAVAYEHKIAGYIVKENAYDAVKSAVEMLGAYVEIVSLENKLK
ncbi:response regulator [Phaeobacter inhibens]|uniref:Response regulator n=1 Tax=Phaeobacter inhibens TaxID=221822 RepID=A0A2I7KQ61_9RHOB|nr:response regulator [Phaeobacter inhibens]AUR00115.1 Response regulator [Phaeobacter inhibens]AUR04726.1 Response regulator [Phaeobacter inhibens]UWR42510.1 response regulator [Phaeobacter inhibens]UWR44322.1 response regulator [Phaeobacter inhibens]UWR48271.1 response regulator [Phaeobacter inhibens]